MVQLCFGKVTVALHSYAECATQKPDNLDSRMTDLGELYKYNFGTFGENTRILEKGRASMVPGYVYILVNPSMPGLIKVGRTLRDSRMRARELSSTGVPTPFQVAFELFAEQHEALEARVHCELADYRVNAAREFFRYPLDKAIALLIQLAKPIQNSAEQFVAEDVTQRLREKYSAYLRPDIVAIRIVQMPGRVWLEITTEDEKAGYLVDQTIQRTDLAFIADTDEAFFRPGDDVRSNANKLVNDYDVYSIIMTTNLFHDEACQKIARAHAMQRHSA